jgi:AhpD family alkylhydroperoxidase
MQNLNERDKELVALGAALGSNCVPCIEAHIPQARKAGLTDPEIAEAVGLADSVRRVPAAKVLETARKMAGEAPAGVPTAAAATPPCGCSAC